MESDLEIDGGDSMSEEQSYLQKKIKRERSSRTNASSLFDETASYSNVDRSPHAYLVSKIRKRPSLRSSETTESNDHNVLLDETCTHTNCKAVLSAVLNGRKKEVEKWLVKGSPCEGCFKKCLEECLKRKNLKVTMTLLWQLCTEVEVREGGNAVQVYPSYRLKDRWSPVIVLLENNISRGKWETFKGCSIYRRKFNLVSPDAAKVMNSEEVRKYRMNPEKKKAISDALKSEQLNRGHSNITLISTSTVRSKAGLPKQEDCIVIGCLVKHFIPFNEEPFPEYIWTSAGQVAVDIRESFCVLSMNEADMIYVHSAEPKANTFNEKLLMGTEIRRLGSLETGTLGGFVKLREGNIGFLTCAHVVFPNVDERKSTQEYLKDLESNYETEIVQPGSCFQADHNNKCGRSRICGTVVKHAFKNGSEDRSGIDAAIVKMCGREAEPQSFVRVENRQLGVAGYTEEILPTYHGQIADVDPKKEVIKVGAKSGLTTGIIVSDDFSSFNPTTSKITMPNGHISELKHLIEVEASDVSSGVAFGIGGDSGALVFTKEHGTLHCIGMLVSTTSYGSACVIPIRPILRELGIEMYVGAGIIPAESIGNAVERSTKQNGGITSSCAIS